MTATLNGPARNATATLSLRGVRANAEQQSIASLAVKLDAKLGDSSIKGQLSSPVAVNVADQAVSLNQLAGSLEIANPAMPMKQLTLPIQGALRFNAKVPSAALDLSTRFDESKVVSSVKLSQFSPLVMAFELDIDQLNIDNYLPPQAAQAGGRNAGGKDAGGAAGRQHPWHDRGRLEEGAGWRGRHRCGCRRDELSGQGSRW